MSDLGGMRGEAQGTTLRTDVPALGGFGAVAANIVADRTVIKRVTVFAKTYFGTTRDLVVLIGSGSLLADACPPDVFWMLPLVTDSNNIVLGTIETYANTNAFGGGHPGHSEQRDVWRRGGSDDIFGFGMPNIGIHSQDTCFFPAGWDTSLMIREEAGDGSPGDEVAWDGDCCKQGAFEADVTPEPHTGTAYNGIVDDFSRGDCGEVDAVMFLIGFQCAGTPGIQSLDIRPTLTGTQVGGVPGDQIGSQRRADAPVERCISLVDPNHVTKLADGLSARPFCGLASFPYTKSITAKNAAPVVLHNGRKLS